MEKEDGGQRNGVVEEVAPLNKVKQCWREYEDFGVASRLQEKEFSHHYDKNRFERRLMHKDIRVTKEEQEAEDNYAAAYYEQQRRDQLAQDELVAMELQRRLDEEELKASRAREDEDKLLALRLQGFDLGDKERSFSAAPFAGSSSNNHHTAMKETITKSPSGNRLVLPPGVTPELVKAAHEARGSEPVSLQPGLTFEQQSALRNAAAEEDRRFAEELQDYELARFAQGQDQAKEPNCVKPSLLRALAKGAPSRTDSKEKDTCASPQLDGSYAVISKSAKGNVLAGQDVQRLSAKQSGGNKWKQSH